MRSRFAIFTFTAIAALLVIASAPAQDHEAEPEYKSPWRTPWTYDGTTGAGHWSSLDPEYAPCNTGQAQSPIDIRNPQKQRLPVLRFEYKSSPLKYVTNNGHTIRVNYHDTPDRGNFLLVGDKRYQLTQLHFHRPSEEYIHGKQYDMVVHLMHKAGDGEVAGVAVLVKTGSANSALQQIWQHMPRLEGQQKVVGVEFNPAGLLPPTTGYYTYIGSITAPPCTEGVRWFVLKTPIEISSKQIEDFAKLYPHDVRPLQPLNGRGVKESQ
ncbi:MAG TPA: carbonic anhydrase family protein [Terriglobales bacterium]|nr:carbonic anhydrase family protein [Terriglobales bacterium]